MLRITSVGLVFSTLSLVAATAELARSQQAPPGPAAAEQAAVVESPDLAALRQSAVSFAEAFNRGDAAAVAAHWTADGEYVDDRGRKFVGRAVIEQGYAALFTENPKSTLRLEIEALRLLGPHTAMEDGRAVLESPAGGAPTLSQYAVVHVEVDGRGLMASVRDTHVAESARDNMADLGWLIGSWSAEAHGVNTESKCRWIGDKSFVERKYTTTGLDGAQKTGLQIIGFNAQDDQVHSWNFSPDGSCAVGVWSPIEDGWHASMTSDISIQLAVNKDGVIRGNYTDLATNQNQVVQGSIDRQTQRAAITVGDNKTSALETGLYNLSKDEAPCLLHIGKDRTEQWQLVRLKQPSGADAPVATP